MKAMVFAAGVGSRLGELTRNRPKCLMQVGQETLLSLVLKRLKQAGVELVVINVHHLGPMIEEYLKDQQYFGLEVKFSREEKLLDTGGGLFKAQEFFAQDEAFFVHNADIYSEMDLAALMQEHKRSGALATLAIQSRQTVRTLLFTDQFELIGRQNKTTGERTLIKESSTVQEFGFSGIQVVSSKLFSVTPEREAPFSIIDCYLWAAKKGQSVRGFRIDTMFWMDIGRPEHLDKLRTYLNKK